jgi:AmmeMemoRadiSam system protein A
MSQLCAEQGQVLLHVARQVLMEQFGQEMQPAENRDDPELRQQHGVFVTLTKQGMLRGCIGSLLGLEPLLDGVRRQTINAAFHDHRFPPLTAEEVPDVHIAISVLSQPQVLHYSDADELIQKLRPRIDGVILKQGQAGATFLPQVWNELPNPKVFLRQLCRKAGLASTAWQTGDLTVQTYQATCFAEKDTVCQN